MVPRFSTAVLILSLPMIARADLAEYLAKPDASYAWTVIGEGQLGNGVIYKELILTSQTWHEITWKHHLTLLRPPLIGKPSHALLIIAGGSWNDGDETKRIDINNRELSLAGQIALSTKLPVALLNHVPFQPIFNGKHEDAIISYTFQQFMQTGEEDWPLLLPMVKAAVRAMDTVQAFAKQEWKVEIPNFVVTGASKRGWTTYLTSAMDKRVAALAPMVFDSLRMNEQMKHQVESFGAYSEQIKDYTDLQLQKFLDTPPGRKLVAIVDPYAYLEKLKQPKLLLLGTNDRYWALDALNLYWSDLQGEKYVLYVPNVGHSLNDPQRVLPDLSALVLRAAGKLKFPKPTWDFSEAEAGIALKMRSDVVPSSVSVWTTSSPTRDFRTAKWSIQPIEAVDGAYAFKLTKPETGFAAVFGELLYNLDEHPLYLSTNVRIIGSAK